VTEGQSQTAKSPVATARVGTAIRKISLLQVVCVIDGRPRINDECLPAGTSSNSGTVHSTGSRGPTKIRRRRKARSQSAADVWSAPLLEVHGFRKISIHLRT